MVVIFVDMKTEDIKTDIIHELNKSVPNWGTISDLAMSVHLSIESGEVGQVITAAKQACRLNKVFNLSEPNREVPNVTARQLVYLHLRGTSIKNWTYQKLGDLFGKDHATALYNVRRLQHLIDSGDKYVLECQARFNNLLTEKSK